MDVFSYPCRNYSLSMLVVSEKSLQRNGPIDLPFVNDCIWMGLQMKGNSSVLPMTYVSFVI